MDVRIDRHNVGYLPMRGDTLRTSTVQSVTRPNLNEALFVARDLPADHPDRPVLEATALGCPVHHSVHADIDKPVTFLWVGK